MENIIDWIRLSLVLGGTNAGGELVRKFGTAENIFAQDAEMLFKAGDISDETKKKLQYDFTSKALSIASDCRNFGWTVITPESEYFPEELKRISDFPLVLYASGNPALLKAKHKAAIVGTRKPNDISLTAAHTLACALSKNGITTVSGGALGIDRAAHEGALTEKGSTICVLGHGLACSYLPERVFLKRRIEKNGLIVSELPPSQGPTSYSFPRRNRIIAALSKTLTVIQSELRGGSMISADFAVRYKKQLFALSPEIFSSEGCNSLISSGAEELKDASQIIKLYTEKEYSAPLKNSGLEVPKILKPEKTALSEFAFLNGVTEAEAYPLYLQITERCEKRTEDIQSSSPPPEKPKTEKKAKTKKTQNDEQEYLLKEKIAQAQGLGANEKALYMSMKRQPESLDSLAEKTGLPIPALMSAVTVLELMELVLYHPGNLYSIK